VVDSNDRDRVGEARDELHRMLNEVITLVLFVICVILAGVKFDFYNSRAKWYGIM